MLTSILANVIAGLGLLFSGLRMVDANLRQATGRRLRVAIKRLTRNRWIASLVGVVTGAVVQSSSGIVFMLVSLVTSGLTTVRAVLPIVTWANVGCGALIFLAVLDLKLAILYLLGVAGAAFAFDRSHKSYALGAVFGVGMFFYGIELMKAGAEPLKTLPWFADALHQNGESLLVAFAGGAAFSFVTQSSMAISILMIGLAQTGLMGPFAAMMAIYGANLGSTFSRMLLSSNLRGSVRQIAGFQDLFKISGVVLFVALLYIELLAGVPLVRALVADFSSEVNQQLAWVFLLFNLTTAILFTLLQPVILATLEKWLPADEQEDLSKPLYLYEEALNEPATALDLIEREHLRLTRRLRGYSEAMRTLPGSPERQRALTIHAPFAAVSRRIQQFQHDLLNRQLGPQESERLTKLQNRLSLTLYLEDSLSGLASATQEVPAAGRLRDLAGNLVESLDFVLMTFVDAMESRGSPETTQLLLQITADRGEMMENLRQEFVSDDGQISAADRAVLLQITSVFERIIWMANRVARLIDPAPEAPLSPAVASPQEAHRRVVASE